MNGRYLREVFVDSLCIFCLMLIPIGATVAIGVYVFLNFSPIIGILAMFAGLLVSVRIIQVGLSKLER